MNASSSEIADAATATAALRLELERSQRELSECHKRMGELEHGEALLAGENRLLEMVAKGESLPSILDGICRLVEENSGGSLCSILLLGPNDGRLWHGAAPSLPASYIGAFGGRAIGPTTGPCGRACFFKKPVIVPDIAADPLGDDYRDLALAHGLRACWSSPIFSSEDKVLGSFAVLAREPRSPTPQQQKIIAQITHLAAVAIERKRTETALRESEERFRRMADTIPEVIWFTSLDPEKVLYVSPSFERIWGFKAGELYANPRLWMEAIHPDDRERVKSIFSRWIAGEQVSYQDVEYRIVQPSGAVRWIHERGVLSFNEQGKAQLASGISTDITEQKKAQEALRASEHLARGQLDALTRTLDALAQESEPDKLLKHVLLTIVEQTKAHSIAAWNRNEDGARFDLIAVIENGRYQTREEAVHPAGRLSMLPQHHPVWREVLRTGEHGVMEDIGQKSARMCVGSGDWHRVMEDIDPDPALTILVNHLREMGVCSVLFVPLLIAGEVAGTLAVRFQEKRAFRREEIDLTRALAHQAMLALQLMRLSQQSRQAAVIAERNRMARDIHDTLAQGFTGVIMQLEAATGATAHGNLAEATNRIARASELARSSLGEARRSVRALRPHTLRNGKLFVALDGLLKRMAEGTNLNAEFHAEGDERSIPADFEEGLLRVTQEALTNAVKHADARNFSVTLCVDANKIQLRVVDDGRGFDPHQEHEGFGLIGMKERVDRMGGEFTLRAKPGVGTEILVELKDQSALKAEAGNEQS